MSFYSGLARRVLAPTLDIARGTHTMRCLAELEESQWWPRERIEQLQSARLQNLMQYVSEKVPYYRRILRERGLAPGDIKSAPDLAKLPVLTKELIRAHKHDLVAKDFPTTKLRAMSTSGSTGAPLLFFSTAEDQFTRGMARTFRALQWAGLDIGDRYVVLARPRHYDLPREQFLHSASLHFKRVVEIDTGTLSDEALPRIAAKLGSFGRTGFMSSPPVLALLAAWMQRTDTRIPSISCVVSGSEQLLDHERRLVANAFGSEPFSKYGAFEAYDIASECEAHSGLHVQAEDIIIEIADEGDALLPPGSPGRILVTNLHNFAMPLIRYDIGDFGAIDAAPCRCGRELPRLIGMLGRMSELIVTPEGRRVFGADLGLESFAPLGVRQFRVVQHDLTTVNAYVEWHDACTPESRCSGQPQIQETLERAIGGGVRVNVQVVEHLAPTARGKYCVVVSEVAPRRADFTEIPPRLS